MSSSFLQPGSGQEITRDQIIVIITQTQSQVQALEKSLTRAFDGLKASVEEMVDRLEADADEMRTRMAGIGELTNGHKESNGKIADLDKRLDGLEKWQADVKTTIKVVGLIAGAVGAVAGMVIGKLWK